MSFIAARRISVALVFIFLSAVAALATVFGSVRGIIHDPQHRPVHGAKVVLHATTSDWKQETLTNDNGAFLFTAVPAGMYTATASAEGFTAESKQIEVNSGIGSELHFQFALATVEQKVDVSATPELVNPSSSTTQSLVSRADIANTPGADRSNSLAMITDYVPGAYMTHDQLHVRGGHQVSWLVDGVPVPNTNIASNVGPQFDPKDIDYLEVQRGGYSSEYGDRAYGTFNVVPRSGFERNNEGELIASYGSYNSTDNQINFGSHTEKFAYFGSLSGNRTELGLETPVARTLHDEAWGLGGFGTIIYNLTPSDQLRVAGSSRRDDYEAPNTPEQQFDGIRDDQSERDSFLNVTWAHTTKSGLLFTLSPFYHFNSANFHGGPNDTPVITADQRASNYFGGQAALAITRGRHNARIGFIAFGEHEDHRFGLTANDGISTDSLHQRNSIGGNIETIFLEDSFKAAQWLTLNGGVRLTHYSGLINENAADPRVGAAIRIPKVGAVLRGFYGRYYQPPPLETLSGALLDVALASGVGFIPLRGERDEQWEVGVAVPIKGWVIDGGYFHTFAKNFFDHDALENSNIFFPLTIDRARIRGWEATVRAPQMGRVGAHLTYSHQYAEGRGGVSGGLTDFTPPEDGDYFFLDHDQRDTLNFGVDVKVPHNAFVSSNVLYGSGFLLGDGPDHFPGHTTLDLAAGKNFGERWGLKLTATNVFNDRYQLDEANTFGGTHFYDARRVALQVRYKFHY